MMDHWYDGQVLVIATLAIDTIIAHGTDRLVRQKQVAVAAQAMKVSGRNRRWVDQPSVLLLAQHRMRYETDAAARSFESASPHEQLVPELTCVLLWSSQHLTKYISEAFPKRRSWARGNTNKFNGVWVQSDSSQSIVEVRGGGSGNVPVQVCCGRVEWQHIQMFRIDP
eukprot:CAMPEP_0119318886 /NCGR_PEP_ID=MMETSP1333-20130426/47910_1 /TAXON_ID=418940 /ORGANISM="Scyphosphaera apsteinii, Strain RCC1455" /LENGTH=167 /DNA_ID=CAMNT_0007325187 /DNA_START=318 /DNA_END=821 /DNA_ORIENTATION=+